MSNRRLIDGDSDVHSVNTLKSWNDNDCVEVVLDDGMRCRMSTGIIAQMMCMFKFVISKKKKHYHIEKIAYILNMGCDLEDWIDYQNAVR